MKNWVNSDSRIKKYLLAAFFFLILLCIIEGKYSVKDVKAS